MDNDIVSFKVTDQFEEKEENVITQKIIRKTYHLS